MRILGLFFVLFGCLLMGCDKQETLEYNEFYEIYSSDDIYLTSDRDVYIIGENPILFIPQVRDELNNVLPNVKPKIVVEGDTLESYEFTPTTSGQLRAFAILPNGLKSNSVRINSITEQDVSSITLKYDGVPELTTNPWSIMRGFEQKIKLNSGKEYVLEGEVYPIKSESLSFPLDKDYIEIPGMHDFYFNLGTLQSNVITLDVRDKKAFDQVELPVVYHFINASNLTGGVNTSIRETNRLFNEPRFDIEENSNKVNTFISFTLATTDPNGAILSQPGVHVISDGNGQISLDQFLETARNNYWDPNKYINIFVASGDFSAITGGDFNPGGWANFAPILQESLPGMFVLDEEPSTPFYNAVHLNGSMNASLLAHEIGHLLSLFHNFHTGCSSSHGDFVYDTYHYDRTFNGDENCFGYKNLRKSNIMDYGGSGTIFTYGQRERLQLMMQHGLFIPTPNNIKKVRKGNTRNIKNPKQVTDFIY